MGNPDFVRRYPLFTHLLSRLTVAYDPGVPVMGISARGRGFLLHVNAEFLREQPEFVPGVLQHELHHLLLGHVTHRKFRNAEQPHIMNVAKEISANEYIAEPLPGTPVTLEAFERYGLRPGQSTLERYELLLKAAEEGTLPVVRVPCGVHGRGPGGPDGDPGTDAGDLIERLTGTDPGRGLDWRVALRAFASRLRTPQICWSRPSRRFPELVGVVPGRARSADPLRSPSLLAALDTSGSMSSEDLEAIAAELCRLAPLARLTVVHCDVKIHRVHPFEGSLPEVKGRGGTDLRPPFERAFLAEHRADGVVYFTDGCGPWPARDPGIPTLWVLTRPSLFACPWGTRVTLPPRLPTPSRHRELRGDRARGPAGARGDRG